MWINGLPACNILGLPSVQLACDARELVAIEMFHQELIGEDLLIDRYGIAVREPIESIGCNFVVQ